MDRAYQGSSALNRSYSKPSSSVLAPSKARSPLVASLLLVAMPGAPSSVPAPSSMSLAETQVGDATVLVSSWKSWQLFPLHFNTTRVSCAVSSVLFTLL